MISDLDLASMRKRVHDAQVFGGDGHVGTILYKCKAPKMTCSAVMVVLDGMHSGRKRFVLL